MFTRKVTETPEAARAEARKSPIHKPDLAAARVRLGVFIKQLCFAVVGFAARIPRIAGLA
jgi:hypothetical protein